MKAKVCLLTLLVLAASASAQYGRHGGGTTRGGRQTGLPQDKTGVQADVNFTGVLQQIDKKIIAMEGPDGNTLQFHCTKKTQFFDGEDKIKPTGLKVTDPISVEARRGPDGTLDAVAVHLEHKKTK